MAPSQWGYGSLSLKKEVEIDQESIVLSVSSINRHTKKEKWRTVVMSLPLINAHFLRKLKVLSDLGTLIIVMI